MNQDYLKTIEKVFPKVEGISELNEMVFHFGDINMVINSSGDVLKVSTPKGSPLTDLSDWTNKNMNDLLTLESTNFSRDLRLFTSEISFQLSSFIITPVQMILNGYMHYLIHQKT